MNEGSFCVNDELIKGLNELINGINIDTVKMAQKHVMWILINFLKLRVIWDR